MSQLSKWTTAKRKSYHVEPGVEYRVSIAGAQKEIKVNSTVNSKVAGIPSPCVSYQHRWIPENCSSDPDGWCYLCHSLFSFEIRLEQSFASLMRAEKNRTWNHLNFPSLPLQIQNVNVTGRHVRNLGWKILFALYSESVRQQRALHDVELVNIRL